MKASRSSRMEYWVRYGAVIATLAPMMMLVIYIVCLLIENEMVRLGILLPIFISMYCGVFYLYFGKWYTTKCAVHEAGHVVACFMLGYDVVKVGLRFGGGGRMEYEDVDTSSPGYYEDSVRISVAGKIAEEILGAKMPGMGCRVDATQAYNAAYTAVLKPLDEDARQSMIQGMLHFEKIDALIDALYEETREALLSRADELRRLSEALIEKKRLGREEIRLILAKNE